MKGSDAKFIIADLVSETMWSKSTKKIDNFQAYSQSETNVLSAHLFLTASNGGFAKYNLLNIHCLRKSIFLL